MAVEAEVPVTPTTCNTMTNSYPVTTTGAMINTEATTSGVEQSTKLQTDVTYTVNTVLTASLATLNVATDEARVSVDLPEGNKLLDSVDEKDLVTTNGNETLSSRPVDRERPVMNSGNMNIFKAAVTRAFERSRTSTMEGMLALPRQTDEVTRSRSLCSSTLSLLSTHDADSEDSLMAAYGSSTMEGIISPCLLAQMVAMERERHRLMNLTTPLTQQDRLCWDNVQFIRDLIFRTNFCKRNSNYIAERIRHLHRLTTWILQLLVCDASCVISFRRELENLLSSCLTIANHMADPDSHHDQGTLLMRPIFPEPQSLDSETLEYLSFDPYVYRSNRPLLLFDRRTLDSSLSQNSTLGVPSLRDEEQFVWVDLRSENGHVYSRYGDPMYPRLSTRHTEQREANASRTEHRSDELDEFNLAESETDEVHCRPRSRVSEECLETTQSVDSFSVQLRECVLRARVQKTRNRAKSTGHTDPSDFPFLEEGQSLVGKVRSISSPAIMSVSRPLNDWVFPFRLSETVPFSVFPNGGYGYPHVLDAHIPLAAVNFTAYENLESSDSSSFDSRVTDIPVEMNGSDVNSERAARIIWLEGAVVGQDSLPSLVLPEYSTGPLISRHLEIGNTRDKSLCRCDNAREGKRQVRREATPISERLQRSRTRSSPELTFPFSDGEEFGVRRYSPNQVLYDLNQMRYFSSSGDSLVLSDYLLTSSDSSS